MQVSDDQRPGGWPIVDLLAAHVSGVPRVGISPGFTAPMAAHGRESVDEGSATPGLGDLVIPEAIDFRAALHAISA